MSSVTVILLPGRVRSIVMSMCLSVCLYTSISQEPYVRTLADFLRVLLIAVALSSFGGIVMCFQFCGRRYVFLMGSMAA